MSPTALQAQTLQKILHERVVNNSYYDDERYNSTLTPDYNKAYELLNTCLESPTDFSKLIREPLKLPTTPSITTPALNYVKIALYGDFNEQLSQESSMEKNRAVATKLLRASAQHPGLFPNSLWEGTSPLPSLTREIQDSLGGIEWGICNMSKTPLLRSVCSSILRPLRYIWDWGTESKRDSFKIFEEICGLLPALRKFESFPQVVREIIHPNQFDTVDKEILEGLLAYADAATHRNSTPKKVFQAIEQNPRCHSITFFHTLTGISTQPELTAALKKRTQSQKMVDGLKTQNHSDL